MRSLLYLPGSYMPTTRDLLLSYNPGGGHTDQLRDLALAAATATSLGRRLVLPPYLYHRDANVYTAATQVPKLLHIRPRLSSIIDVVGTNSDSFIDGAEAIELHAAAHSLPRCSSGYVDGNFTGAEEDGNNCVVWLEPPEPFHSVSSLLKRLQRARHARFLHFGSMLDVLAARRAKRYPLATWEQQLGRGPCTIHYRRDVLSAARRALSGALPVNRSYVAAHVRALRRDRAKSECPEEYLPRLKQLVSDAHTRDISSKGGGGGGAPSTESDGGVILYLATDSVTTVVPQVSNYLRAHLPFNVSVVASVHAKPRLAAKVHLDSEMAMMALDAAAVLGAADFAPAPRSGLSVHFSALRRCEHGDGVCEPARATCVPFASSGCGGVWPKSMLRARRAKAAGSRIDARASAGAATRAGSAREQRAEAERERPFFCPPGSVPQNGVKVCTSTSGGTLRARYGGPLSSG